MRKIAVAIFGLCVAMLVVDPDCQIAAQSALPPKERPVEAGPFESSGPPTEPNVPPAGEKAPSGVPVAASSPDGASGTSTGFVESICLTLGKASLENDVPIDFFTRLIWQESRFNPNAQSYAGAQGIAQFMPATARGRGLSDPFDPHMALQESAKFLRELRAQFGNLGLAAAAYNAGPGRVRAWLDGRATLPGETRAFVMKITGHAAEEWIGVADEPEDRLASTISCTAIAKLLAQGRRAGPLPGAPSLSVPAAAALPWGLQLAGNTTEARALADFKELQKKFPAVLGNRQPLILRSRVTFGLPSWFHLRVSEMTRERAAALCSKLEAAGGKCIVLKN